MEESQTNNNEKDIQINLGNILTNENNSYLSSYFSKRFVCFILK